MEDTIFPKPAVAGVLTHRYVEARRHNDHPDDERRERTLALQEELQGTLSTPHYLLLDPANGEVLGEHAGPNFDAEEFREFLLSGSERRRDPARVADASR